MCELRVVEGIEQAAYIVCKFDLIIYGVLSIRRYIGAYRLST